MARARFLSFLVILVAACARPDHRPAPLPPPRPATTTAAPPTGEPSGVKIGIFEPTSARGNWAGVRGLDISPAPASLVVSCLPPGAAGWISINIHTNYSSAATASIVEASLDVATETRECIRNALTGLHSELGAVEFLVYVTFSPP